MMKKTVCQGCGKQAAGGGQRFCRACLCDILCGGIVGQTEATIRKEKASYMARYRAKKSGLNSFTYA